MRDLESCKGPSLVHLHCIVKYYVNIVLYYTIYVYISYKTVLTPVTILPLSVEANTEHIVVVQSKGKLPSVCFFLREKCLVFRVFYLSN